MRLVIDGSPLVRRLDRRRISSRVSSGTRPPHDGLTPLAFLAARATFDSEREEAFELRDKRHHVALDLSLK